MMGIWIIILLVLLFFLYGEPINGIKEGYEDSVIVSPTYLKETAYPQELEYTQAVIQKQDNEIKRLKRQVRQLAESIDDAEESTNTKRFYRRKLSNKYYQVAPYLSEGVVDPLNLEDDDFSNKTLSTIKFLSQTRPSKFYGTEVHFPTELCGNFCSTSDQNAALNEQIDLVRPITATGYIRQNK